MQQRIIGNITYLAAAAVLALAVIVTVAIGAQAGAVTVGDGEDLQAAIDAASDGDTITVSGTHGAVTVGGELTLESDGATLGGVVVTSPNVSISGFTITNASGHGIALSGDVSGLVVTGNVITGNEHHGVHGSGITANNISITNNTITDNNGTANSHGIFLANVTGDGVLVSGNTFSGHQVPGETLSNAAVQIYGSTSDPVRNVVLANNTSNNDGAFAVVYRATGVQITGNQSSNQDVNTVLIDDGTSNVTISDNVFAGAEVGVSFGTNFGSTPTEDVVITGNTITGMTRAAIVVDADSVANDITVSENSFTDNEAGIVNESSATVLADNNYWGGGEPNVQGQVVASVWYVDEAMTTTNLDGAEEEVVPGVPDTAGIADGWLAIALAVMGVVAAGITGLYMHKRRA